MRLWLARKLDRIGWRLLCLGDRMQRIAFQMYEPPAVEREAPSKFIPFLPPDVDLDAAMKSEFNRRVRDGS